MDFELVDQDQELARSRIGETVNGKWKLVELLGCGGMAAVFGAEGPDGQRVALKMLHPQIATIRDIRERFLREGLVANGVSHPGVVRIIEQTSRDEPAAVLVMERLDGESLSDVLRRNGDRLSEPALLGYLDQLLDVLVAAHSKGIVHRDLKPDNLFLTREGVLKVLDFGIARVRDGLTQDQKTRTGVLLGTLPFMSPEQALGKQSQIDGRTDLFAVGAIAFYALSGRPIHDVEGDGELIVAMATKAAPTLRSVVPTASPEICAVVDQALAFSRDARYPDAQAMLSDVRAVREHRPPPHAAHQASSRSQPTGIMLSSPTPVRAPSVAEKSAEPGSRTVVGPGPNTPTRIADSSAMPTSIGPGLDTATRVGNPHSEATIVGPHPDSATRVGESRELGSRSDAQPGPSSSPNAARASNALIAGVGGVGAKSAIPFVGPPVASGASSQPAEQVGSAPNESKKRRFGILLLLLVGVIAAAALFWIAAGTSEETGAEPTGPTTAQAAPKPAKAAKEHKKRGRER